MQKQKVADKMAKEKAALARLQASYSGLATGVTLKDNPDDSRFASDG
jgi:hypothetical protein